MQIYYGRGAYLRGNGNLPRLRLRNMFVEQSPSDDDGIILLSREALSEYGSAGNGPVTGVYQQDGVFNGDVFCVSGGHLFCGNTDLGLIDGTGAVSFAGTTNEVVVTAGMSAWSYNGTNLQAVAFPDGANVTAVEFHDGLFLYARAGGHKWYWSDVLDGRTVDPLNFASAESKPDALLDLRVVGDMLFLCGEESIEPWANTGDADIPYARQELSILTVGIKATGALARLDNSLLFVGNDNIVYRLNEVPERLSDHGIEEQIGNATQVTCFGFVHQGHSFFCIRLTLADGTGATYALDIATRQWCEFASWGRANFAASCATEAGHSLIFGDDTIGTLYTLSGYDEEPFERLFSIAMPLEAPVSIDCIRLWANTGWTEDLAGQGADPTVELRLSRDQGATFGNWRSAPLGEQGKYRTHTEWRRNGMFDDPGMLGEVRNTDPVPFRVSSVNVPDQRGGRSR